MGIFLFFTFLFCDLITCLLCKYVYQQNFTYQNGMLLGVHIPKEQVKHPQVEALCEQSRRRWRIYQNSNIALGTLLCLLGFVDSKSLIVVWVLWFLLYLGGMNILMLTPLRRMYRLKQEQGWIREKSRRTVYIDTRLSTLSKWMAPKAFWHLLILMAELGAGMALYLLLPRLAGEVVWHPGLYLIGVVTAGVTLFLWTAHLWWVERRNAVYSQSSKVNIAVNQLMKRALASALLGADGWNGISWLYLLLRWYQCGGYRQASGQSMGLGNGDWLIYAALQIAACLAFMAPWGSAVRAKKELLDADDAPMEVDDDEYWKNGWYENPQDSHLFVPNRLCETNYTLNMARPAARWFNAGIWLTLVGSLGWTVWLVLEKM